MLSWYVKNAPIRVKLRVAFGSMSAIVAVMLGLLAYQDMQFAKLLKSGAPLPPEMINLVYVGVGVLVLTIALGVFLTGAIANPYVNTVVRMEGLAAGDLDSPVRYTDYKDCVGRLTRAMQTFKDSAIERIRLQGESGRHQEELDRRLADAQAAFAAAGKDQNHLVEALATSLEALAAGDLTPRLPQDIAAEYRKLGDDFNTALNALEQMVRVIVSNARGIHTGAGEISNAADNLSRRTEQQAAALEETAAALDEITATVKKAAEGADLAEKVVSQTTADAVKSGQVVAEAVTAMNGIEQSSRQISQIIGVIDEIAFQTNLLALNAGVEAARAGDAGRGFVVVASEVRALAQRSADAAKEIKTLIGASTDQVESGVRLVRETGQALERIVSQVTQINGLIAEISSSAREQATGLTQVNTAVNGMDQVTQQNAAMVEESTAASHALAQEADELSRLVAQFSISGGSDPSVVTLKRPAARAPARPVRTHSSGGAALARRLDAPPQEDSWEEF